jgi:hypothetical protein
MISTLPTGESSEHRRQDQASSKHSSAQPHQAGAPKHQAHDADKTGEIGGHLHGVHFIAPLSRSGPQTDISAMGMIILTGLCQALSRPGPAPAPSRRCGWWRHATSAIRGDQRSAQRRSRSRSCAAAADTDRATSRGAAWMTLNKPDGGGRGADEP